MKISDKNVQRVLAALENNQYDWRTINGIVKETQLKKETIKSIVNYLGSNGKVILGVNSQNGNKIYSTRSHYKKRNSITVRMKDVVKGEVVR